MESFQPTQTFVYQRVSEKRTADYLYWKNLEVCCLAAMVRINHAPTSVWTIHRSYWPHRPYTVCMAVSSSHRKIVWRVDHRVWRRCDKLIVLFDLEFVAVKSFPVVSNFSIAHAAITCHVIQVCTTSHFFKRLIHVCHCSTILTGPLGFTELQGSCPEQGSRRLTRRRYQTLHRR